MTSLNIILHAFETRKFVMALLHGKQGLLCDKSMEQEFTKFCTGCYQVGKFTGRNHKL